MKNKDILLDNIKNILISYENIVFVYIFGSYSTNIANFNSDIDLGVYTKTSFDLLTLGHIIYEIEKVIDKKVDLIELNDLFKKNPLLAYEIVTKGKTLFCKKHNDLINFKRMTYQNYFDTIELRKEINSKFYQRINTKRFGDRNYA